MLTEFRVKNLRSLKDTGTVKLSPLTILLGENSSGKSTFLRTFPLLKQSAETTTRSSILWFGKYVDFGDFDQALIRKQGEKEIVFSFGLTVPDQIYYRPIRAPRISRDKGASKVTVNLRLASLGKDGLTRTAGIDLDIEGNSVKIDISESNKISSIFVNGVNYSKYCELYSYSSAVRLLPYIRAKSNIEKDDLYRSWWSGFWPDEIMNDLVDTLRAYSNKRTSSESLTTAAFKAVIGSKQDMLIHFKKMFTTNTWKSKTHDAELDNEVFVKYNNLLILARTGIAIYNLDEILDQTFRRVSYIEPIRASAQRYYRSQDIGVKELDSKGENLAMFLRNLSEREKNALDEWSMKEFGFRTVVQFNGGHVHLGVAFDKNKDSYNLADMGFGYSQVIPIMIQLWTILYKPTRNGIEGLSYTCVIEQPELHLHPRMQSKLAEMLVSVVNTAKEANITLHLIIETHSEVIVNKIGLMTAMGVLRKDDSTIVLFSKEPNAPQTSVEFSGYRENGSLHNWPYGFFDYEA
ncbi:AAA family ATPase [Pseudomonas sp. GV085]|uniref:AAA family ATPase n=1 Tax=Pseudomonas sp. GV085 TaxID=2135756 RepID=UPI000D3B1737|nr:AAA family ATPase [Pseudomonas sp. GV085]PTR25849.1 AAA ATPase-like protein [Pseudomonas sp. GV085]